MSSWTLTCTLVGHQILSSPSLRLSWEWYSRNSIRHSAGPFWGLQAGELLPRVSLCCQDYVSSMAICPCCLWLVCTVWLGTWVCYRKEVTQLWKPAILIWAEANKMGTLVRFLTLQQIFGDSLVLAPREPPGNRGWKRTKEWIQGWGRILRIMLPPGAVESFCSLACSLRPFTSHLSFTLRGKPSGMLLGTTFAVFVFVFLQAFFFHDS